MDAGGGVTDLIARLVLGRTIGPAVDASEERVSRFVGRSPRLLRVGRVLFGALFLLTGLLHAAFALAIIAFGAAVGPVVLVMLLPFAIGVGMTIYGVRLLHRGIMG